MNDWCSENSVLVKVANGEVGWVYCPYSQQYYRWPSRVVIFGLKAKSLTWFEAYAFINNGKTWAHQNLNILLPVAYLGLHSNMFLAFSRSNYFWFLDWRSGGFINVTLPCHCKLNIALLYEISSLFPDHLIRNFKILVSFIAGTKIKRRGLIVIWGKPRAKGKEASWGTQVDSVLTSRAKHLTWNCSCRQILFDHMLFNSSNAPLNLETVKSFMTWSLGTNDWVNEGQSVVVSI